MLIVLLASGCGSKTDDPPPESPGSSALPGTEPSPETKPPAPADDRPIILAFGDSLTAGSGLPPGSGYPEMLQLELDKRGYRYHVVNAGIGGDTTGGGVARLQSALDLHPEIVVLELGGNDGLRGLPTDSMQANLEEMIGAFQKGGARVILAGMTLPRNFGPDYIGAFEKVYPDAGRQAQSDAHPLLPGGCCGETGAEPGGWNPPERGWLPVRDDECAEVPGADAEEVKSRKEKRPKLPSSAGVKKWSLINVQLSFVIFGCAFGAASLRKHCAKRHHR
jgi:acyl-CoA thioesterase-1